VRNGFYNPYFSYGHYSRLEVGWLSEWRPSLLQLVPMLTGCAKHYQRFCNKYRSKSKPFKLRQLGGKLIAFIKALLLKHFCQSTRQQQKPQALRWSAIVAVQSNCYAAPAQNWQYIAQ